MAVTMREVAAHAGVSPVVVSRVLHNKANSIRVSESTAERVRQSAATLGYRCNVWARNFRTQRTMQIGVIHGLGFSRPSFSNGSRYFADLMEGLVEGAFEHGYSITLCPKLLSQTPEDALANGRFDGLVWYSSLPNEEHQRMLNEGSVPTVVLHSTSRSVGGRWPTVLCDNRQGIELSVDHLISLGHKRVAFFTEFGWGVGEAQLRQDSMIQIMHDRGLPFTDADIIDISKSSDSLDKFLESDFAHTAVVSHNDGLAKFLYDAAAAKGIDIPGRLSVVGFDSTGFCNELRPSLTSVYQPLFELGRRAIGELVQVISGDWEGPSELVIPCRLDIRESTAPARS
ncbi:MAG: LacI family DNA-binding transcriptional regulator [Armatimonadota bacterium]